MRKSLFLAGFGLLPLWMAIGLVYLGSHQAASSSRYWSAAPWLLVAAIPACIVTLAIALSTLAIYARASGIESQRRKVATLTFLALILAASGSAGVLWIRHEKKQQEIEIERQLLLDFVHQDRQVLAAAAGPFTSSLVATTLVGGEPVKYDIAVYAARTVYAIVDVARTPGGPVFSVACITPLSLGKRAPFKDPCRQ